jgi:hypothetical protein
MEKRRGTHLLLDLLQCFGKLPLLSFAVLHVVCRVAFPRCVKGKLSECFLCTASNGVWQSSGLVTESMAGASKASSASALFARPEAECMVPGGREGACYWLPHMPAFNPSTLGLRLGLHITGAAQP